MRKLLIFLTSFIAIFLFAFSRSFQSNSIWLVSGFLIYLILGFIWNKADYSRVLKWIILGSPILLDTIFIQSIAFRPILVIIPIFAFLGLGIGLNFQKKFLQILILSFLIISNLFFAFYFFPNQAFEEKLSTDSRTIPNSVFINNFLDTLSTKDLKSKVVLIDMWYAKCGACFKQFNEIEKIYQYFKNNPKVSIIGLNNGTDEFNTFLSAFRLIREKKNLQFPLWLDVEKTLMQNLEMKDFPQTIVVDTKGRIRYIHKGFSKDEQKIYAKKIIAIIESLLKEEKTEKKS